LERLVEGESSVINLATTFDISLPAGSRYFLILKNAGLISHEKDGRVSRCALVAGSLRDTLNWIETYQGFWEDKFDPITEYLDQT